MQTFLPYPSFKKSAKVLDYRRLGKQRAESKQILLALRNPDYGWQHHPAVLQWKGFEPALVAYTAIVCLEWRRRGYQDNVLQWLTDNYTLPSSFRLPAWLGMSRFHVPHRSKLLFKFPEHYRSFWPDLPDSMPYWWPSHELPVENKK